LWHCCRKWAIYSTMKWHNAYLLPLIAVTWNYIRNSGVSCRFCCLLTNLSVWHMNEKIFMKLCMNFVPLSVTFHVLSILHGIKKKNASVYQRLKGLSDFHEMRYRRFNLTWEQVQWKACFTVKRKRFFWSIFITFFNPILDAFCTGYVHKNLLIANFGKIGKVKTVCYLVGGGGL